MTALLHDLAVHISYSIDREGADVLGSWQVWGFYAPVFGLDVKSLGNVRMGVDIWVGEVYDTDPEEAEASQYVETIGYFPAQRLDCSARGSYKADYRLLGHVVLHLAELLHGYINVSEPALPLMHPGRDDLDPERLHEYAANRQEGLQPWHPEGPGRIFELYFDTGNTVTCQCEDGQTIVRPTRWYYHIMDAEFFRHYLQTENLKHGR